MVVFEEPGNEFELGKIKKKNLATKMRTVFFLVVFLMMILFIIKNNFSFAIGSEKSFQEVCNAENVKKISDDDELTSMKIKNVVTDNYDLLKKLPGFDKASVDSFIYGYQQKKIPVISLFFNSEDKQHKNIPNEICGFRVKLIYK